MLLAVLNRGIVVPRNRHFALINGWHFTNQCSQLASKVVGYTYRPDQTLLLGLRLVSDGNAKNAENVSNPTAKPKPNRVHATQEPGGGGHTTRLLCGT
jgi:hypothetical protein